MVTSKGIFNWWYLQSKNEYCWKERKVYCKGQSFRTFLFKYSNNYITIKIHLKFSLLLLLYEKECNLNHTTKHDCLSQCYSFKSQLPLPRLKFVHSFVTLREPTRTLIYHSRQQGNMVNFNELTIITI